MISKLFKRHKKLFYFLASPVVVTFFWLLLVELLFENNDSYAIAPKNTQWIEIEKNNIAYQYFPNSTGENMLLIGGTTAWSGVWKNTIADLNDNYNIYTLDLPPFGFSIVDNEHTYNLENQADLINAFLEELNVQNVTFLAHSYGAGPAMEAILRNPSNYQELVIIDGAIHVDRDKKLNKLSETFFSISSLRYFITTIALHVPGFMKASLKYLVYDNSKVDDFWVDIYKQPLRVENTSQKIAKWFYDFTFKNGEGISHDSVNYKKLDIPVLIIWGKEDIFTPLEQGQYLQKIIPRSKLIVMENVGHIPMIDDHEGYMALLDENLGHTNK